MSAIDRLKQLIHQSQQLVFFGGAGVSTESGIPDFRSAGGIFMQDTGMEYMPEQIISYSFFKQHPKAFYDFHFEHLVYPDAEPNSSHLFIADLEKRGKDVTIVTQNIDGLHQEAGSSKVLEIHGTIKDNYCMECGKDYTIQELERDADGIPRCTHDNGIVRPNVVMYEEALNQDLLFESIKAIQEADTLIIAGTSLVVYPAAGLINYFNGDNLIVINKTPISVPANALVFEASLGEIFGQLID